MFEHSSLQEAYTGALIAGKGKTLNGINTIIEKTRFKYEDWARVRFGAGTPWRRCWAVITPPDEKQVKKQKALLKKAQKTGYTHIPVLKGDIRFYEKKRSKRSAPIATIADAFSAYAIYPQSKPLIDQSTLVKIEGKITIHSDPPTTSEGFVFVMPEVHPAVSGFEMMLRWLFPTFDTFALYGRPNKLVADVNDVRGLMFAMPKERQYGYLDVADIVSLIVSEGNAINSESEWRLKLKQATAEKIRNGGARARPRTSLPAGQRFPGITFDDDSGKSSSSLPIPASQIPPQHVPLNTPPLPSTVYHQRSTSESTGYMQYQNQQRASPSLYSMAEGQQDSFDAVQGVTRSDSGSSNSSLFQGRPIDPAARRLQQQTGQPELSEVPPTPTMTHPPSSRPQQPLPQAKQVQRQISNNTLNAMGGGMAVSTAAAAFLKETGSSAPPPPAFPPSGMQNGRSDYDSEKSGLLYPPPPPPGPPPHLLPSQNSQITAQSSLPYQSPIEPPPGFEMQNSQVLLAGPPPTGDTKVAYNEGYIRPHETQHTPPPQNNASSSDDRHPRFSWQNTPAQTPVQPIKVVPYTLMEGLEPLPSPPIPAKIPLKSPNTPQVPNLQTANISRKPLPAKGEGDGTDTPLSTDSIGSLVGHLMNQEVLDRIGRDRSEVEDEDTFDRRRASRLQQMLSDNANNSGSEYGDDDDDEPDYASVHTTEEPPKRDADKPRAGVMKVVGTKIDPEVVVGDVHYRQNPPVAREPVADIPRVDFGMTINHGRNLSAESRGVSRGNAQFVDQDSGLASQHGTLVGDARRTSQGLGVDWNEHNRASSRSSGGSEVRDSWNRPSPESGHERNGSHGSDSGESKRRSMVWQPGMVQVGGSPGGGKVSPEKSAEQYVTDRAAAAQQQSRSRYLHQRRPSQAGTPSPTGRNISAEHLPPRPNSRGGNAAFIPNGLVSSAGDLSAHLSAREQEYVAKQTGSTLLHIDGKKKQPPHQAGLLGAIETRQMEKRVVGNSATVQQAIVQRQQLQLQQQQQQQQQRQDAQRRKTPSPRLTSYGAYEGTNSYFPQQPGGYVAYGQQQQQVQPQQMQQQYYNQQGYGQQQYGNQQSQQGYSRQ